MLTKSLNKVDRYFTTQLIAKCTRVFLVYFGFYLYGVLTEQYKIVSPLILGAVASALAEMDGHWRDRLYSSLLLLLTFAITLFVCNLVFNDQILYGVFLALLSFFLIMLGAVSDRFSLIGFCNLVILIYYSIMLERSPPISLGLQSEGYFLLIGAATYAVVSLVWGLLFANQPVRQNMADVLRDLAAVLHAKANLFEYADHAQRDKYFLNMSTANQRLVGSLNAARQSIYLRAGKARGTNLVQHFLRLYFISQEIHERATSTHYAYDDLTKAFFHSDIVFRLQRVLRAQANACAEFSDDLRHNRKFSQLTASQNALAELQLSTQYLIEQRQQDATADNAYESFNYMAAIQAISDNLTTLQKALEKMQRVFSRSKTKEAEEFTDDRISGHDARSWRQRWEGYLLSFSLQSPVFRHAARMSFALLVGYFVMRYFGDAHGFWILLTTLFVCRSGLAATRTRVFGRVAGTIIGLVIGWIFLQVLQSPEEQLALAIIGGLLVFAFNTSNYMISTTGATVMVLMCFNQSVDGFDLIVPRLIDTLIGTAIALSAVYFFLPDWLRKNRLTKVVVHSLHTNKAYLTAVLQQYFSGGKQDDMPYRVARRNAHNADAALSALISSLIKEPKTSAAELDFAMRQQVLLHTMLNYLSGLAAHREQIDTTPLTEQLFNLGQVLAQDLQTSANALEQGNIAAIKDYPSIELVEQIRQQYADDLIQDELALLLFNQLEFLVEGLENFVKLIVAKEPNESETASGDEV